MTFEYKCVAGPTIVAVRNSKARDQAVKAFEEIMNAEARHGWEYVGIDEFHISEPQGLLSRKRVYVPSKILVFRRTVAAPAAVAPAPAQVPQVIPVLTTAPALTAVAEAPEAPAPMAPPAAQEPRESTAFRDALQAMTDKVRAAKG